MTSKKTRKKKDKKTVIKFVFDNAKAADHFLVWLSESGEQGYWEWMEVREQEEEGNITALNFDYWTKDTFGEGDIVAKCGRMDND